MSKLVRLEVDGGATPGAMRQAIMAHFKCERLRRTRAWLVWVPALASVPLWVEAGWPGLLAHRAVVLGLALWAAAAVALVGVLVREYTWSRRRLRSGGVEEHPLE
jgi:hypothetical protein